MENLYVLCGCILLLLAYGVYCILSTLERMERERIKADEFYLARLLELGDLIIHNTRPIVRNNNDDYSRQKKH